MRQLTSIQFLKITFIFVLQLQSQINKSFSRSPTKPSKVTDELPKRIVQPWTLQADICSMNFHIRSGINGQDGEAACIIIHVGNLNSKSLTLYFRSQYCLKILPKIRRDIRVHTTVILVWKIAALWKLWKLIVLVADFHDCPGQDGTGHVSELFYFSSKQV